MRSLWRVFVVFKLATSEGVDGSSTCTVVAINEWHMTIKRTHLSFVGLPVPPRLGISFVWPPDFERRRGWPCTPPSEGLDLQPSVDDPSPQRKPEREPTPALRVRQEAPLVFSLVAFEQCVPWQIWRADVGGFDGPTELNGKDAFAENSAKRGFSDEVAWRVVHLPTFRWCWVEQPAKECSTRHLGLLHWSREMRNKPLFVSWLVVYFRVIMFKAVPPRWSDRERTPPSGVFTFAMEGLTEFSSMV